MFRNFLQKTFQLFAPDGNDQGGDSPVDITKLDNSELDKLLDQELGADTNPNEDLSDEKDKEIVDEEKPDNSDFLDDEIDLTKFNNEDDEEIIEEEKKETPSASDKPDESDKKDTPENADKGKPEDKSEPEFHRIDDVFISNADEKDKILLQSIKGEILSPKALQNYLNAQRMIGKRANDVKKEIFPTEKPSSVNEQKESQAKPDLPQQISKVKTDMLREDLGGKLKQINEKFTLPEDLSPRSEEYIEWAADFNYRDPDGYKEFRESRFTTEKELDSTVQKFQYVAQNHPTITLNTINQVIKGIEGFAKETLGIDLKEVGIDLKEVTNFDEENQLVDSLLYDGNTDQYDSEVVNFVSFGTTKFPLINPKVAQAKFFELYAPKIKEVLQARARSEGYSAAKGKKVLNSLSDSSGGKQKKEITIGKNITQLGNEEIDKVLDQLEEID